MSGRRGRRGAAATAEAVTNGATNGIAAAAPKNGGAVLPPRILPSFLGAVHSPRPRLTVATFAAPAASSPPPMHAEPQAPPQAPATPPAAAAPPLVPPAPPPPPPPPAPSVGFNYAVENGDAWRARQRQQDDQRWRSVRSQQAQGDTDLIHVWADLVRSRKFPPQGCTIWLTRKDAQRRYQIEIRGVNCAWTYEGEFPDRALWEVAQRERRYPNEPESFDGRIRAVCEDGSYQDVGAGDLFLPPIPNATAQPNYYPAAAPQAGAPPMPPMPAGWPGGGGGYGSQPAPWTMMALTGSMGSAMQTMAMMEMMRSMSAPSWAQQIPIGAPPAADGSQGAAFKMWEMQQKAHADSQTLMMTFLLDQMKNKGDGKNGGGEVDQFGMFERMLGVMDKFRKLTGGDGEGKAIQILDVKGKTLVTKPDGSIDEKMTVGLNGVDMVERVVTKVGSNIAAAIKAKNNAGGGGDGLAAGGASSPRPKGT